ncbi:hypothetical protein P4123_06770 [Pseudomonas aeruginosa]|nr:hypothetical protein [Pseudomonas aeruginosa]
MHKNKKTRPAARTVGCLFALGRFLGLGSAAHATEAFLPELEMDARRLGRQAHRAAGEGLRLPGWSTTRRGGGQRSTMAGYDDDKTERYTDQFALGVHMDLGKILGAEGPPSSSSPSPSATGGGLYP